MNEFSQPERPLIICGMGRSGTTLIKSLVLTAPGVIIYPEPQHECLAATFQLLEAVRKLYRGRGSGWRKIDDARAERNVSFILRHVLCGIEGNIAAAPRRIGFRYGFKQPNAEGYFQRWETLLGSIAPIYLYCYRDPIDVYDSYLSMPWGNVTPESFQERLEGSLSAVLEMLETVPGRTFLLPVHQISADRSFRTAAIGWLFRVLGLPMEERTEAFVREWPAVNSRSNISQPASVASDEKERRREVLAVELRQSQLLRQFLEVAGGHPISQTVMKS